MTKSAVPEHHRQLVYDTDGNNQCYDVTVNKGYADYLNDPFKASNTRGDWGINLSNPIIQKLSIFTMKNNHILREMYAGTSISGTLVGTGIYFFVFYFKKNIF